MATRLFESLLADSRYVCDAPFARDYDIAASHILGTGMSGSVFVAFNRKMGTTSAVKRFDKCDASSSDLASFRNEVEIQLALNHPNVAQLQRVYETESDIHLVMEHLRGGDVFNRLLGCGSFDEQIAAETLQQMLVAVSYLHSVGVTHRDIKLENFVYENEHGNRLKLIDFGFASQSGSNKMARVCGSLHAMAPEMFSGEYTSQVDIWSIGVAGYLLLCGTSPWGHTDKATRRMIRAGQPAYRGSFKQLSIGAQQFVQWLLTSDPTDRPSADGALKHSWLGTTPGQTTCFGASESRADAVSVGPGNAIAVAYMSDRKQTCREAVQVVSHRIRSRSPARMVHMIGH